MCFTMPEHKYIGYKFYEPEGTILQDVITTPAEKYARVQGDSGFLELLINHEQGLRWNEYGKSNKDVRGVILKKRDQMILA